MHKSLCSFPFFFFFLRVTLKRRNAEQGFLMAIILERTCLKICRDGLLCVLPEAIMDLVCF